MIIQMLMGCSWVFVGAHLAKGLGGACLTKVGEVIVCPRCGVLMGAHLANGLGGAHSTKVEEVIIQPRCGVIMGAHGYLFGKGAWGCSFNQGGGCDCSARACGAHGCLLGQAAWRAGGQGRGE